jgi:hypothetical protein
MCRDYARTKLLWCTSREPVGDRTRTLIGTHEGHHCQEGVRIWPGWLRAPPGWADCSAGSSSRLPGPSRRAARGPAGAPAAAQRRGRTSLTPASGGRPSGRGRAGCGLAYTGVVCVFLARGWRSGLASTHPAPRQCAAAMTICPGPGCSVM